MKTNVKTTGGGAAQSEIIEALRTARASAYDSAVIAMETTGNLRDLFKVIVSLAKAGDLESIITIAKDGIYHAEDWHNIYDCTREELESSPDFPFGKEA